MNAELCKQALAMVGNPNILVNIISRRVRQLTSGGGGMNRPLVVEGAGMGTADIALKELIEGKIGWDIPEELQMDEPAPRKRKRH